MESRLMRIREVKQLRSVVVAGLVVLGPSIVRAETPDAQPSQSSSSEKTRITIYPLLAQLPIFGADIHVPSLPGGGDGGGGDAIDGSTDLSFNGAALAGFRVDAPKWFVDINGLYAGLSAKRTTPRVVVHTDAFYAYASAGWRFYRDLAVTGGVRELGLNLHAEVGDALDATAKPRVWNPLVGLDWRHRASDTWTIDANAEGGGFGVGADADVSAGLNAYWNSSHHFALQLGYGFLYYKVTVAHVTVGTASRSLVSKQTLHGPSVGVGFWF
jgi:hypothetical protein